MLPPDEFERWCLAPLARLVARLQRAHPTTPIIAFPRGAATELAKFADIDGLAAIGLDTAAEPRAAAAMLPERLALQGNLDPLALLAGGRALDEGVARVLSGFAGRAHIFNLGHGVLPETPIAHVEQLIAPGARRDLSGAGETARPPHMAIVWPRSLTSAAEVSGLGYSRVGIKVFLIRSGLWRTRRLRELFGSAARSMCIDWGLARCG